MHERIHIGTSGWSYKHWRELFYPHGLAAGQWLPYYANYFSTTEINGSFYRLPSEETVLKWEQQVATGFIFCPKMSRYLTHMKKLKEPEEPLERFFSVFAALEKKMGPVLVQLPPMLKFNYEVAEHFYRLLKLKYKAHQFVVEVRHDAWLGEKSLTLMAAYDIGFVISQSAGFFPYAEAITSENVYLRLHGPAALYASSYPDGLLKTYAIKIRGWEKEGRTVWVYFNNDINGYATGDAVRLQELLNEI